MQEVKMLKLPPACLWTLCVLATCVLCQNTDDESERRFLRTSVNTRLGRIEGTTVLSGGIPVRQFLGVPFAKAPLGERRFKKPEPMDPWRGTLQAVDQPPACIQYTDRPYPWYDNGTGQSEDCLFLNIWAPTGATGRSRKAVLFWIFGGGFFIGSTRQPIYDGRTIAASGDIVVVTVNYRLGALGFLFSDSEDAPGNVGLWDVLLGLTWVRDNIASFGGDPAQVTIAGQGAGSIIVGLLSVSPLARGLYARQIMESGSPAYLLAENNTQNLDRSQEVATRMRCANRFLTIRDRPDFVVSCLRRADVAELVSYDWSLIPPSPMGFVPQYGDEILPQNPRIAIAEGNFQKNNVLIGNNRDEGSFLITTTNPDLYGFFGEKNPNINKSQAKEMMRTMLVRSEFPDPDAVVSHYLPDSLGEDEYELSRRQLYTASGDSSLLCPTVYFAESYAEQGSDVYFYFFTRRPSTTPWAPWMGVAHYEEVQFVFGSPIRNPARYETTETALSAEIIGCWTRFVRNGRPNRTWPKYSRQNPSLRVLDVGPNRTGTGPHRENCDFFRPYFGF